MRFGQHPAEQSQSQPQWADLPPLPELAHSKPAPPRPLEEALEGIWGEPTPVVSDLAAAEQVPMTDVIAPAVVSERRPAREPLPTLSVPGRLRWQGETPLMYLEMSCAGAGKVALRGQYDPHSAVCDAHELRDAAERAISLHRSYSWWKRAAYQAKVTIRSDHGAVTVLATSGSLCIKLPATTGLIRGSKSYVVQTFIEVGRDQFLKTLSEIERELHRQAAALIPPAASYRTQPVSTDTASPDFALPQAEAAPLKPTVAVIGSGLDGNYEVCERLADGSLRIRRSDLPGASIPL